jgi:ABC-2 type transport system permease protein
VSWLPRLRPGSEFWLLAHEFRLFSYELGTLVRHGFRQRPGKRGFPASLAILLALVYLALHAVAWSFLRGIPDLEAIGSRFLLHNAGLWMVSVFALLVSAAMVRCVRVLYERGDIEVLLCSPLPARTVLASRLGGVALGTVALALFTLGPFANMGCAMGHPRYLAIYPALICTAGIAAALAMLLTLTLARRIGVKATAIVAQVPAALGSITIYLAPQLWAHAPSELRTRALGMLEPGALLGPASPLWYPVKAMLGAPLPLLAFLLTGVAIFQLASSGLEGAFVRAMQQARGGGSESLARNADTGNVPAAPLRLRYRPGVWRNIVRKEWLLIVRDRSQLSKIGTSLAWLLLAMGASLARSYPPALLAAAIVFFGASLAGVLARVTVSGEEAPDLLGTAPVAEQLVRRAKLLAATAPVLLLMLPFLGWTAWADGLLALAAAAALLAATACAAHINRQRYKPLQRSRLDGPPPRPLAAVLVETVSNSAWALTVLLVPPALKALAAAAAAIFHATVAIGTALEQVPGELF